MNPPILSKTPISMAEMKDIIVRIRERDKELNFRTQRTEEYLQSFKLDSVKNKELFEKLKGLGIPRLKDIQMIKIVDIMPRNVEELKLLMQGYSVTINADNMKKIVDTVSEYVK